MQIREKNVSNLSLRKNKKDKTKIETSKVVVEFQEKMLEQLECKTMQEC